MFTKKDKPDHECSEVLTAAEAELMCLNCFKRISFFFSLSLYFWLNAAADCTFNRSTCETAWRQRVVRLQQLQCDWRTCAFGVRVHQIDCEMCDGLWDIRVSVHMFVPRQCCIIADGKQWPDNDGASSPCCCWLERTHFQTHAHTLTHTQSSAQLETGVRNSWNVFCDMAGRLCSRYL